MVVRQNPVLAIFAILASVVIVVAATLFIKAQPFVNSETQAAESEWFLVVIFGTIVAWVILYYGYKNDWDREKMWGPSQSGGRDETD